MRSTKSGFLAACSILCLVLAVTAHPATKKKQPQTLPTTPMPTDRSLGFFSNTRAEMLASVKRVGIIPVGLPYWFEDRDDAKLMVQDAVAKYLRLAGMDVVGPETYRAAYDRFNAQMGGMYDPKTGYLREDVSKAVYQNARREFISKERLDGYVVIRIQKRAASYAAYYTNWDGVRESSNGKPVPNGVARFLGASGYSGTLPALSMTVQIANAQDRIVFGRVGGIQPTSYFNFEMGEGYQFVDVSTKDLLHDEARIDRAARVATLPLIHTPKEIWLGDDDPQINAAKLDLKDFANLPPPESKKRVSPLLVPREQILGSVHRVALSPLNAGGFAVPEAVQQRMVEVVRKELEPLHWEIVDSPKAREVLHAKFLESNLFDPLTGKRDEARATAIRKSVFPLLGSGNPPDAVLWIGLIRTGTQHQQGDVEWDGVDQNGFTMGPVVKKLFGGSALAGAGTGGIMAASMLVYLADVNDTELYRSRGGLQLLQKLKFTPAPYGSYQPNDTEAIDLAPSELFGDPAREQPAVHAALRDLVLTPEALAAELNPNAKKDSKKKTKK